MNLKINPDLIWVSPSIFNAYHDLDQSSIFHYDKRKNLKFYFYNFLHFHDFELGLTSFSAMMFNQARDTLSFLFLIHFCTSFLDNLSRLCVDLSLSPVNKIILKKTKWHLHQVISLILMISLVNRIVFAANPLWSQWFQNWENDCFTYILVICLNFDDHQTTAQLEISKIWVAASMTLSLPASLFLTLVVMN